MIEATAQTMTALVNYSAERGAVELREVPIPQPGYGEVLLRVRAVGVCGSDLHQYHGTQSWSVNWPVTLGHEFCGEVAELGAGVVGWQQGERVACETAAFICGVCALCRTGFYNLCPKRLGFGYGLNGAAARYVVARAPLLHRIPENVTWEQAAMTEPCCVATNAVLEQSHPRPGDTVVVLGPGPVGLLCTNLLAATRPSQLIVAGIQRDARRLEFARQFGATHTVMTDVDDVKELMRGIGDGLGADLVIDVAGISATLKLALDIVRPAGQITKIGWGPQPLNFSLDQLVQKAVTLQGSFSHTWATWERVLRMLNDRTLNVQPLIQTFPLAEWQSAFAGMERGEIAKAIFIID